MHHADRCPADPEEVAEAYALGKLTGAAARAFEVHCKKCLSCAAAIEREEKIIRVMRAAGRALGWASRQSETKSSDVQ